MPGPAIAADDWNRLHFLIETLNCSDLDGDAGLVLIQKLFAEDDLRIYAERAVSFRCRCSGQKAEDVLRLLGEQEIRAALKEKDDIEVVCEYCGQKRCYDRVDVSRLFVENAIEGPESVQ